MATSLIGGAFGYLKKSIGSVTYTTSTSALDGKRRQVARQKVTEVRNPNSVGQILQRMKLAPAQRFYAAFEKAAGSVQNNPLSHSFEGYEYNAKNRARFMQLALQGDPKAYVPKGYEGAAPGVYQVSEGTLPSMPSGEPTPETDQIFFVNQIFDAAAITSLAKIGVEEGDQLTCVGLLSKAGNYSAVFARTIVKVGNAWEFVNKDSEGLTDLRLKEDGINFEDASDIACAAFILSRGTDTSSAKRSTAIMTIAPDFKSLMSPDALQAAIDSYLNNTTYNSLNSDWYLNQGSTQVYNGEVVALDVIANNGSGKEIDDRFLIGKQLTNGRIVTMNVFTLNGKSDGQAILVDDSGKVKLAVYPDAPEAVPVTGAQVLAGITAAGYDAGTTVLFSRAIAEQGGFTPGNF